MPSADLLRGVPLFEDLDADDLARVAAALHERTFAAGETIVAAGEPGDGFFLVESGEANVVVDGHVQGTLAPGDHFGEIALLMGAERTATVVARTDVRCLGLTPADFRELVEGSPTIAWKLLESMTLRLG
jgi:CRP-like cAMP-binding protein